MTSQVPGVNEAQRLLAIQPVPSQVIKANASRVDSRLSNGGSPTQPVASVAPVSLRDDQTLPQLWQARESWTAFELVRADFEPMRWAIPSLLPEGCSLLVGAPKVGKSWAALDIAVAVASGGKALGALGVESGPVLYLALEDGPRRLADRLKILLGDGTAPQGLTFYTTWTRGRQAAEDVAAWMWAHPATRLVVVDVLAKIRPSRTTNSDRYADDYADLSVWQRLASKFSVAILMLHHDRKANADDFVDAVSGTHGIAGSADSVLLLQRARMESFGTISLTGRDVVEHEMALQRVGPVWHLYEGPLPDPNLGDRSQQILELASQVTDGLRAAHVAGALGVDLASARTYLSRLADSGRLTKAGRGLYRYPEVMDATIATPS